MAEKKNKEQAVAFISSWRKRADDQKRKYTGLSIGYSILAFGLCIMLLFVFQSSNYDRIVDQNMKYVQDSSLQKANRIEAELKSVEMMICNLSHQYAILEENTVAMTVREKLDLLRDTALFDHIGFVTMDGMERDAESVFSVSDRAYFQNAMNGESGYEFIAEFHITGEGAVVFSAPVEVNGEIIGVMVGYREQERLDELFTYTVFNYKPDTYLLLGNGVEVAHSASSPIRGNLFDYLSGKSFVGETDYAKIMEVIADPERTTVTFSFLDNRETLVGVIVQLSGSDWVLLAILPHDITNAMISKANGDGISLLVSIVAVFVLLIGVLIFFLSKQRTRLQGEMSMASEQLAETVENDKKQLSIIESLARAYSSLYYIDVRTGNYTRVTEQEAASNQYIPSEGKAVDGCEYYVKTFIHESYRPAMREFLAVDTFAERVLPQHSPSIEFQRTDGHWCRAFLVPSEHDENGRLASVVFAVQRIDQEKQSELAAKDALEEAYNAAQVANRAKTIFLSNMSHDIRTPMNAIMGMTTIASANIRNPEKVADCLGKINNASKHLLGLINEVLDMSKIESGNVDLSEEEFSLSDIIDNLISINQPAIRAKNHTLIVKVSHIPHEKVIGDSVRLQQVFTNLLSNAIKYTPENGTIEISLAEKNTNKDNVGWYEIIFRDNGIGMSEEFQKVMFEPFARADDQRISRIQGTGLGMSIARTIIRMMNGDITVQSQLNQGTTFTVSFSLRLQPSDEAWHEDFEGLSVLVVDDDETCCETTCDLLNGLGMKSEWASSGAEAVKKIAARHEAGDDYYAAIVDWRMPGMDGLETSRQIRLLTGDQVPIIVFSAYDWSEIEEEARAVGVNHFLSKPLFKSRVITLFNDLVGDHSGASGSENNPLAAYNLSGRRLLLVEDNEINREIAVELLSAAGLEVDTAVNGREGVDKFEHSQPGQYDAILMDIQMPVMNGYEASMAIRALARPDAGSIPIIAMTANAFSSDVRAAIKAGMNDHLAKPINVQQMLRILHEKING